jgi:hypothetical protein
MNTFVAEMKFLFNLYDVSNGQEEIENLTKLFAYLIKNRHIVNELEEFKLNMMMRARSLYDEVDNVSYKLDEKVKAKFKKTLKDFILFGCTGL